ncbi:MAG TPA: response regulator [Pyrinomonadaceae bacterium]|nr:response regulator [Pyrinomonadaceae bacterium]
MSTTEANPTVMVVDDSADIRELTRLQLGILGYQVVEAAEGRQAVELASRECPALILMDLTMPVLDGLEATRLIRGLAELCGVVIVAFTALHGSECRASALAAGCDDYVQKPLGMEGLSDLLERHLRDARL